MNSKWLIGIVLVLLVIGGFYIVSKKSAPAPVNPQKVVPTAMQTVPTTTTQNGSSSASIAFAVEGNEFAFSPSTVTVKKGQEVKVTFKNTGKYPHNFTISDLNIQTKTIKTGEEDTVTFSPDKVGTFTYVCTVPGHADKGMKGTLTVQ